MSDIEVTLTLTPDKAKRLIEEQDNQLRIYRDSLRYRDAEIERLKQAAEDSKGTARHYWSRLERIANDVGWWREKMSADDVHAAVVGRMSELEDLQGALLTHGYTARTKVLTAQGEAKDVKVGGVTPQHAIDLLVPLVAEKMRGASDEGQWRTFGVIIKHQADDVVWCYVDVRLNDGDPEYDCSKAALDVDGLEVIKKQMLEAQGRTQTLEARIKHIARALDLDGDAPFMVITETIKGLMRLSSTPTRGPKASYPEE